MGLGFDARLRPALDLLEQWASEMRRAEEGRDFLSWNKFSCMRNPLTIKDQYGHWGLSLGVLVPLKYAACVTICDSLSQLRMTRNTRGCKTYCNMVCESAGRRLNISYFPLTVHLGFGNECQEDQKCNFPESFPQVMGTIG